MTDSETVNKSLVFTWLVVSGVRLRNYNIILYMCGYKEMIPSHNVVCGVVDFIKIMYIYIIQAKSEYK